MQKPDAPSCGRNREAILAVFKHHLKGSEKLLEIGSGTGQHAVYFAEKFPNLIWNTSDRKENHLGIELWLADAKLTNLVAPISFEVGHDPFPGKNFDAVFTCNTLHIMSWHKGRTLLKLLGENLEQSALVFIYGPFNYAGKFTSESNQQFEGWLKSRDPDSGIRNFEDVESEMAKSGFSLLEDRALPANNRMLVFSK
ncbi:MAG: DUF938 domain-containing protein [Halobacteriovoraceae bacterium]|jgi:cyclopropane fatty-acyl-phospholipid synthase-like methyltransferase|nr:DUF938 domain-containing protein [Halobacteriovoraceae bacterium]MBT5095652.1 DUF938 domain-containing protein [Halobacteriovoraceae bacterium]